MNVMPLLGFIMRRGSQIKAMLDNGKAKTDNSHIVVDLLQANLPFIKKNFPALAKDGLADDVLATLKEVLAPDPVLSPAQQAEMSITGSAAQG